MLRVNGLHVSNRLLPLTMECAAGEVVGIIGPNGAGKSSFMETLVGSLKPAQGALTWCDENLLKMPPLRRRELMSYIPQHSAIYADITVAEALYEAMVNLSWTRLEQQQAVARTLREFELEAFAERRVLQLSGGEQRRVHCACSVMNQGDLVIADEPTAGLDLYYQLALLELLVDRARNGALVLLALHDLSQASMYCDRVALFDHGTLLQLGTPNDVLTSDNLAAAYRVQVDWFCDERGVAMRPHRVVPDR